MAAEAVAQAKAEIAARGLISDRDAELLRHGGGHGASRQCPAEPARGRAVPGHHAEAGTRRRSGALPTSSKAQIQVDQRQREPEDAQLALDKARIGLAVLLFPDFGQAFYGGRRPGHASPTARLSARSRRWRRRTSPDIRAAQAAVEQQTVGVVVPRRLCCPPSPPITSSASTPTSSPSIIPKAPEHLGSVVAGPVEHSHLDLGRGAQPGETGGTAAPAGQERSQPDPAPAARQPQLVLPGGRLPRDRRSLRYAIPWTFPPRASG